METQETILIDTLASTLITSDHSRPFLVAISGKDGSGKTYMANKLAEVVRTQTNREVIRISIDDFMNKRSIRKQNPNQAVGCYEDTFNLSAFEDYALKSLRTGGGKYVTKIFDQATDAPVELEFHNVASDAIVIVDGVFLYQDRLNAYWNMRLQLEADEPVLIERGALRDAARKGGYAKAVRAYIERYMPSQRYYYETEAPLEKADVIIDVNRLGLPAVMSSRLKYVH